MQNDILAEAEKLVAAKRDDRLAGAKESYIRKVQVVTESNVYQSLQGLTGAYSGTYPEISHFIDARAIDLSVQFAEALGIILRRELFGGETPKESEETHNKF